jgi:hypothetical protein
MGKGDPQNPEHWSSTNDSIHNWSVLCTHAFSLFLHEYYHVSKKTLLITILVFMKYLIEESMT